MKPRLADFPFVPLPHARLALRLAVAAVFLGHAAMRLLTPHHLQHLAVLFESRGLPHGLVLAWGATLFTLVAAPLLVMNRGTRWLAAGLLLVTVAGMVVVQSHHGWWVAEYGDGGMESGFVLCVACLYLGSREDAAPASRRLALPFPTAAEGDFVLRLGLALFFLVHATSRFSEADYFRGLGIGLAQFGMPFPYALGLLATAVELGGGCLLVANVLARWAALGLFGISLTGIVFIHLRFGWFVGEFGNGGAELSVLLLAICLVVAATDRAVRVGVDPARTPRPHGQVVDASATATAGPAAIASARNSASRSA